MPGGVGGDRSGGCNKGRTHTGSWVCLFLPGGDWGKQQSVQRDCSTHLIVPECALKVCREQARARGNGVWVWHHVGLFIQSTEGCVFKDVWSKRM